MLLKNPAFAGQVIRWLGFPKPLKFTSEGLVNIPDEKLALALLKNVGWEKVEPIPQAVPKSEPPKIITPVEKHKPTIVMKEETKKGE